MNPKKSIECKIFDKEFKKWLIKNGYLIKSFYDMNEVSKIVRDFHKENSDNQFAGMKKDTDMWVKREKLLEAEIEELNFKINNNGQ